MRNLLFAMLLLLPLTTSSAGEPDSIFEEYGVTGSFIVCEVEGDFCVALNGDRCKER